MTKRTSQLNAALSLLDPLAKVSASMLRSPLDTGVRSAELWGSVIGGLMGSSSLSAEAGDKRFLDPIWETNPAYKALKQSYLAWSQGLANWVDTLDLKERDALRAKLLVSLATDTLAPTNSVIGNPTAMKKTLEQGGQNLVKGFRAFLDDLVHNNGLPRTVDTSKFDVGQSLACTPGQVVYREDHLELIQYQPQSEEVFETPIFIVPPQINKFYVWDLAPDRSIIEYLVGLGHQVFIVAWRNPDETQSDWNFESYIQALDRASQAACDITKADQLQIVGACSGGMTAAMLLALWSAKGIDRAASFSLFVAILEVEQAPDTALGLFANMQTLELARQFSSSKGLLEGKDLERAFAWLRPNDLIWSYWVNNYLLGNDPPAFDILFWNADTTNLPSALHGDLLELLIQGGLDGGDGWYVDGHKISLQNITCDAYVVGGETDHITPWEGCYLSVPSFGGKSDFVLSKSGHIQSLINPPGNPRARFLTNTKQHSSAVEFLDGATEHSGSWWPHWNTWLSKHAGALKTAPASLGAKTYVPLCDAPGTYAV